MYQRKNTPSISTLQYCQHTREYLKEARTGKGTTGSVLGTSPFLTKTSRGAGTQEDRGSRTTPSAEHRERPSKHKTRTQTHRRTTKGRRQQKENHLDNQESFLLTGTSALCPPHPFRRCYDRFLGRPRHAAALGTIFGVRFASQEQMGRPCRVLLRSWLVSDQPRLSDQLRICSAIRRMEEEKWG